MRIFPVIVAFVMLITGCATSGGDPKPISNARVYTIPQNYTTTSIRGLNDNKFVIGLAAGKYMAELESNDGTFYRGPDGSVILLMNKLAEDFLRTGVLPEHAHKIANQIPFPGENGGIWIPKPGVKKPARLYYYFQPAKDAQAMNATGALISAYLESARGKIEIAEEIHDERILRVFNAPQ